ncbi:hypothetical protein JL101_036375 (plasmid) [Skermanella rosea]|uniref:relaxase/mobilization nuclease domain-containing protein n=1 Tax=Skermanella rosea TaxID=1817965 RepID=UPI001932E89A|nr:hypothetical protein [Skermanella rosea]UEM08220.1 hypothetical protein JL101_036375 [Skermanella rosea]
MRPIGMLEGLKGKLRPRMRAGRVPDRIERARVTVGVGWTSRKSLAVLQRVVVKVSYEGIHKLKERLDYIRQEEKAQGQEHARAFDASRNEIDADAAIERWQSAGDDIFFKIPISPEKPAELVRAVMNETGLPEAEAREEAMRQLTRATMSAAERDWGTRVQYFAVTHFDTKTLHTHAFLRAVDEDGNPMRIDREYIKEGFRIRASQWVTRKLGQFRTEQEIRQGVAKTRTIRQEIAAGKLRIAQARAEGRITRDEAFKLRRSLVRGDAERASVLQTLDQVERRRLQRQEI